MAKAAKKTNVKSQKAQQQKAVSTKKEDVSYENEVSVAQEKYKAKGL